VEDPVCRIGQPVVMREPVQAEYALHGLRV
jgi:hypothetical protein